MQVFLQVAKNGLANISLATTNDILKKHPPKNEKDKF